MKVFYFLQKTETLSIKVFDFYCLVRFYLLFIIYRSLSLAWRIRWLHICRGVRPFSSTRLPVGRRWRPRMFKGGVLVAEKSLAQQPSGKVTYNISFWSLLGWKSGRPEKPDPINCLVMSSPNTYMIVPAVFFKLHVPNRYPTLFYLKGARRRCMKVNCAVTVIYETI